MDISDSWTCPSCNETHVRPPGWTDAWWIEDVTDLQRAHGRGDHKKRKRRRR